ncbi:hypothetical protein [Rhabdothermincola salaria]|uniref:hypothetical protein n=1 Tax=Rhabdothermincola salaria TaxID=2903142 RepID=UPI001E5A0230|nr:hypothetical protein [Rhabdothermincola salaria]MCD9623424.1 hypothetical protein [Rhabdothermincola salaria]
MLIVFVVLTVVAVLVIALVTIGRLTYRLEDEPPTSVYDLEEAVEFVADRLPEEMTAELTYDDVRALLLWHLDYLEDRGVARDFGENDTSGPLVAAEDEGLAYVLGKAAEGGLELDDVWVVRVLDASGEYLEAIGAIGGQVPEPPDPSASS